MNVVLLALLDISCACPNSAPARSAPADAISAVGDVDADGVRDLAVAVKGGVALYSSATGALLWTAKGSAKALAPIEDCNADHIPDVLTSSFGLVRILSGKDGSEVLSLREPTIAGFGWDVDSLGDLDGDGFVEFLVAASVKACICTTRPGGEMVIVDTGSKAHSYCHRMRAIGDVDADGSTDIAWVESDESLRPSQPPRVRVLSGRTRETVLLIDLVPAGLAPCTTMEGYSLAPAGDPDGDGLADVLVGCVGVWARSFRGSDGSVLVEYRDPLPGGNNEGFADTLAVVGDVDCDGVGDVAFGCKEYWDSGDQYYAAILSGRTGEPTRVLHHAHYPGHYHFVAAPGDVDGDGVPDLAVFVPECGSLTLHSGHGMCRIRTLQLPGE